jgi:hypothetical protein
MSRRRENIIQRFALGRDPLDDSLNASWDAVVRDERASPPAADPDDVAFLRGVHALEAVTLPSPSFLMDLEHRLVGLYPSPVASPDRTPTANRSRLGIILQSPAQPRTTPRTSSLFPMRGAVAVLAVLMVASLLVLYQSVPRSSEPPPIPAATLVEPTMETMVQLDVTPSLFGIPEASTWTHMYFNLIQVDPGKSFTTDTEWYTTINGPLLILVLRGELTIQPAGPALFYSDYQRDQTPAEMSPGQSVSLGPDAAIVYSAVDTATGSNPGSEPVLALQVSVGHMSSGSMGSVGTEAGPIDIKTLGVQQDWELDAPPTTGASISIQRLQLAPFDSFVFDPDPELMYLCVFDQFQMDDVRMANGAFDGLAPNIDTDRLHLTSQLTYPDPGPNTIFNFGGETVDFYFLVVKPIPDAATPPA